MGNISYRLPLKTISLFAVSCSGIGFFFQLVLFTVVSHSITRYSIYTQFLMFFLFVSSFSLQRSKNVCRRRLSLIGLIHTYRRWVSCRVNVILSIQLSIYLSIGFQSIYHWNLHIICFYFFFRNCDEFWPWGRYLIYWEYLKRAESYGIVF